jgi:hypothetical protein
MPHVRAAAWSLWSDPLLPGRNWNKWSFLHRSNRSRLYRDETKKWLSSLCLCRKSALPLPDVGVQPKDSMCALRVELRRTSARLKMEHQ